MMKGRDGLMDAPLDALLSDRSHAGATGCHWLPRDRRPPLGALTGATVALPGGATAGGSFRASGSGPRPSALRGTTLAPLRSLSAPSTTTRSPGERPD